MSSGSTPDRAESGSGPTIDSASQTIERQLEDALDAAESQRTRFHLRQALQLVEALNDERR
jgi:hypothetical protein